METGLLSRTSMTGWMAFLAFAAAYLPGHDLARLGQALFGRGFEVIAVALLSVVSAPFFGWLIGTLAIAGLYLFCGHPYRGEARKEAKQALLTRHAPTSPEKDIISAMQPDDVFSYLFNSCGPRDLRNWCRRRRSTQFIGYNWTAATVVGVVVGLVGDWRTLGPHLPAKLPWIVGILLVCSATLWVGMIAARECERVELLWLRRFLRQCGKEISITESQEE